MATDGWALRFHGVGNSAAVELGSAMATIERDGRPWLAIDCGTEGLSAALAHYGTFPDALFVTHVHLDHVGGFERLFGATYFDPARRGKVRLYVPAPVVPLLHQRVGDYPNVLAEGGANFWDAFQLAARDALKAALEGGIEGRPSNVLFYATSNRRHLMPHDLVDNERGTAINPGEAVEEKVSLSDRFGLWLGFHHCGQDEYLAMIDGYVAFHGLKIEPEDLLKFGLIPEFIGRLPVLATLGDLSEQALIEILTRPKNALAKQYMRMFEMEGVKLRFQEEALHSISRKAIQRKTGARGLRSILEGILLETMFELPTLNGVQEVVITADVVDGKARPLYTYSDKGQAREQTAS